MNQAKNAAKVVSLISVVAFALIAPLSTFAVLPSVHINSVSILFFPPGKVTNVTIQGANFGALTAAGFSVEINLYIPGTTTLIKAGTGKVTSVGTTINGSIDLTGIGEQDAILNINILANGGIAALGSADNSIAVKIGNGINPQMIGGVNLTSAADFLGILTTVLNWVFTVFIILSILFILLAAFEFITAGGDDKKISDARTKLIWAAVGIIVALIARGLPFVLGNIIGAPLQ